MPVSLWLSWLHNARFLADKMVNCDHREIVPKAHHLSRLGAGQYWNALLADAICAVESLLRSDPMFKPLATIGTKYLEPLLAHSGAPADSDDAKQPLPSGTLYTPYSEQPALPEVLYQPYAEKPSHEAPYEPYKGI
jgi:hypothetical protein